MGLLDNFSSDAPQAQTGGLLGAMPAQQGGGQASGLPPMPPELMQVVQQMKGAPPQQRDAFIQIMSQKIASSVHDPAMKQQVLQAFMQAMGGDAGAPQSLLG